MPSYLEGYQRQELLILDTGPIRELVTFHAVEHLRFEKLRRHMEFIKDRESYRTCTRFIASFAKRTTSALVAVELHRWIRDTDPGGQGRLWNRVYEEFQQMDMSEEMVQLVGMDGALVTRFGPVDVSLLELVRRHASHKPLLLTTDSALKGECTKAGLYVRHLREVMLTVR